MQLIKINMHYGALNYLWDGNYEKFLNVTNQKK